MEMNSYFIGVSMTHEAWVILDAKETPFAPKAISLTHGQKPEKIFQTAVFQVCQDGKSWENVFTFASYKRENQTEIYLIDRDLSAYRFFRLLFLTAPGEEVELRNFKVCDYVPTEYMSSEVKGGRPSISIPYVELEVEGFPEEDANGIYLPNVEEFPVLQSYSNGKGWELKEDRGHNLFYIEKRVQAPVLDGETGEPVVDEETGEPVMEEIVERKYTTEYTCSTPCTEEATYPERIQWEELPKAETPGYFRPFYIWSREFIENGTNEQFRVLPRIRQISHTQIEFRDESNQTWYLRKTQGTTEGEEGEIYGALEDPLVEDVLRTHGPYLYYKGDSGKKLPFWFFSHSPDRYPGNLYFPDGQKGTLPIGGTGTWKVTGSSSFSSRIYSSAKEIEKIPSWTILKVSGFLKENMEEDERINGYYILEEPVTAFKGTESNPKFRWEGEGTGSGETIGKHTDSGVYLFRRSDGVYAFADEDGNPLHGELISETSSSLTGKWGEEDRDGRIDWVPPYSNNLNRAYMIYGAGVGKDGLYFPRGSEGVWSNGAWDMQLLKYEGSNNYIIPGNHRLSFRKTNGYPEFSETVTIDRYCTPSDCLTLVAEKTKINNEDKDYLTFTALEPAIISSEQIGNPSVAGLMYSVNGEKFKPYRVGQNIHLNTGSHVRFYNFYGNLSNSDSDYFHFLIDGEVAASGNILSLLDHIGPGERLPDYCFYRLFADQIDLRTAPELPSFILSKECYAYMFSGTGIYSSPHLPAKHLSTRSYEGMFKNATGLSEVSCEFEEWSGATTDWLEGVSPTGTFQISDYVPIKFGEDYFLYDWEFPNKAVIRNATLTGGVVFEYNSERYTGGGYNLQIFRDRQEYSNQGGKHNDLYYRRDGEEYALQYRGETISLKEGEIVYLDGPVNKYGGPYGPYANIRVNNLLISGGVLSLSRSGSSVAAGEFAGLFQGNETLSFKKETKFYADYDFYANLETFGHPSYSNPWSGSKKVSFFLSNMKTIGERGCVEMFKGVQNLGCMELNLTSVGINGVRDMFNSGSVDASTITLEGTGDFSYMFRNAYMTNGVSPKIIGSEECNFEGLFESSPVRSLNIFIRLGLLEKAANDDYLKDSNLSSIGFYVSNVTSWYELGYKGTTEDGSSYQEYNSTIAYAVATYPNSKEIWDSRIVAPNMTYWNTINYGGGGGIFQE